MRCRRAIAVIASCVVAAGWSSAARAGTLHPAVTVRGATLDFYAGHLVIDAQGAATLDDGILHVQAQHIIVDLTADRYVAAGDVRIEGAAGGPPTSGAALGIDLATGRGVLIALDPATQTYDVDGASVTPRPAASAAPAVPPAGEPLALPDLQGELPFATAASAVAHLNGDVRLAGARVIVPGGKDVFLPSYVYTFSSEIGYSASNVAGSGEEVPVYFGSTRDSVDGAHFTYNAASTVGLGYDHRIVDGDKAYDLFSVSPLNGPTKDANFTWQEQINAHASQTLNGSAQSLVGSQWSYAASDSLHRSYLELSTGTQLSSNQGTLVWQGAYEPLGAGWMGNLFQFHVSSEYGRSQLYSSGIPVYHTAVTTGLQAPSLLLDPSSSLTLSANWRYQADDSPLRQFEVQYAAQLQHRWNSFLTTSLTDTESPTVYYYPGFGVGSRTYVSQQEGLISYGHGDAFALSLDVRHDDQYVPPGPFTQPWYVFADVRFRVSSSLSIDLSRSYGFGYLGQRFGPLGFQIFP